MSQDSGRRLPLSLPRRFMCDLMRLSRDVPLIPVQRRMRLAAVAEARQSARPRPGWCALFIKAFARVAGRRPELRRAYFTYPWPHLYEHPVSVAAVAVDRRFHDEDAVFIGHVRSPDQQTLSELDDHLRRFKDAPLDSIGIFRRTLTVSSLPWPLRRLAWWIGYHSSGRRRAKYMGTFGISVVAGLGASLLDLYSPLTATLNYGVLDPDGSMDVRLFFDHRVLDGAAAARALEDLEGVLTGDIVNELRFLRTLDVA